MIKVIAFLISALLMSQTLAVDTLFNKQWALNNNGQNILVTSGELTRQEKQGLIGSDIGFSKELLNQSFNGTDSENDFIVAVIDSGIDSTHPDLQGRLWFNKSLCENLSKEEMSVKPCYGWNYIDNNSDLGDTIGHGTHVAGIIAANINNIGVAGITPKQVKIMPLKVVTNEVTNFIHNGRVVTDVFADAMGFAIQNGAKVINLSLGWPKIIETPKIRAAFARAKQRGIAVIAASGNNGKDIPTFPCTYSDVICVGSHDNLGKLSTFSNFGGKVDVLAPGEFIVSTHPQQLESRSLRIQGYEHKQGSSQAAPFVAGTIANIWVKNPQFNLDQVKAQLFASSHHSQDGSSLFGTLSLKSALTSKVESFTAPLFKNLLNVIVNNKGVFNIALPVKNYLSARENIKIEVSLGNDITLEKSSYQVSLSKGEPTTLSVTGTLSSLKIDSHQMLKVVIDGKTYQTKVVFNRDISSLVPKQTLNFSNVQPELIAFFNNKRKGSLLRNVITNNQTGEEYYYFPKIREKDKSTVTLLMKDTEGNNFSLKNLTHPKGAEIISIYKRDLNFDGKEDYLLYGKLEKDQKLSFWFLNDQLDPLYREHSLWEVGIDTFAGLPESPIEEKFSWIKTKHSKLGKILVPLILRNGLMPEKDNTKDILDRVQGAAFRHYYLSPVIAHDNVTIEMRVLDSYHFFQNIAEKLNLFFDDSIRMSAPLPQTTNQVGSGQVIYTLSTGKMFDMKHFRLVFTDTLNFEMTPIFTALQIESNNTFPIYDLETNKLKSDSYKYVTLFSRQQARIATLLGQSEDSFEFTSKSWQDPIFNYVVGFSDETKNVDLIESRYYIYAMKNGKQESRLPIYRESSFPSLAFAETYKSFVLSRDNQSGLPALFIDSTLVFGDQNYVMVWDEDKEMLTRPVSLSFIIPRQCISLGPVSTNGKKSLALQCYEGKDAPMSFKLYPLNLDQ